jgi:TM2 domain-containing membrane protein YozV
MSSPSSAGWYPDPAGAPTQRYYDGTRWTDQLAPFAAPVPAQLPPAKSAAVAGLLQLFFGTFGLGRFYIGDTAVGGVQLCLGIAGLFFTMFCFIGMIILVPLWLWTFIDGIMMFVGAVSDSHGRKLQ